MESATTSYDVDIRVCELRNLYKDFTGGFCFLSVVGGLHIRKIGCTSIKYNNSIPVWDENFKVTLRSQTEKIRIEFYGIHKKSKLKANLKIGEFLICPSELSDNKDVSDWYMNELAVDKKLDKKGKCRHLQLRVVLSFEQTLVLLGDEYRDLSKHLMAHEFFMLRSLVKNTTSILPSTRASLGRSICHFVMGEQKTEEVFCMLISEEIESSESAKEVFSTHSITAKILDNYFNLVGSSWVEGALKSIIALLPKQIIAKKFNPNPHELDLDLLGYFITEIFESIFSSTTHCPINMKNLLYHIKTEIDTKFPTQNAVKTSHTVLSTSIITKLFLPHLETPKSYDYLPIDEHFEESVSRSFSLFSAILRKFGSFTKFNKNAAEINLQPINSILKSNVSRLLIFLDQTATHSKEPWKENLENVDYSGSLARILKHVSREKEIFLANPDSTHLNGKTEKKSHQGDLTEFMRTMQKVYAGCEEMLNEQTQRKISTSEKRPLQKSNSLRAAPQNSLRSLPQNISQRNLRTNSIDDQKSERKSRSRSSSLRDLPVLHQKLDSQSSGPIITTPPDKKRSGGSKRSSLKKKKALKIKSSPTKDRLVKSTNTLKISPSKPTESTNSEPSYPNSEDV
jgi:hypothetical protein